MPQATINGIELYYELHGDGPPIAFAHGVGGNHAVWYQQVPFFSRAYQAITLDQRGFGRSPDTNGLGRASFADDLHGLLDHLGVGRVALVVQSMGGITGMGFSVRYPERVAALVMADTLVGITMPEPLRTRQRENAEATSTLSQLERVVSKALPLTDPAKAELYLQLASFNPNNENRLAAGGPAAAPITMEQVVAAAEEVPMLFLSEKRTSCSHLKSSRQPASLYQTRSSLASPGPAIPSTSNDPNSSTLRSPASFRNSYLGSRVREGGLIDGKAN